MRTAIAVIWLILASGAHASDDCRAEVDAAFEKLRHSKAFRMKTTIVNGERSLRMTVDYMPPDRMHQKITMSSASGPVELIVIGGKAWSNNGVAWAEMPSAYAEHVAAQLRETVAEPPPQDTKFTCLGQKELEGKSYAAYRALVSAGSPAPGQAFSIQTVYVDPKTGLPERNIVTSEKSEDERLFDGIFSFPEGIRIEPPMASPSP